MRPIRLLSVLCLMPFAASAGDVRVFKDKSGVINIVSTNSRLPGTGERYYKRVDSKGTVHFTSKPPMSGGYSVVYVDACPACNVHSTINWNATRLNTTAYASEIAAAASDHGVDAALVRHLVIKRVKFHFYQYSISGNFISLKSKRNICVKFFKSKLFFIFS